MRDRGAQHHTYRNLIGSQPVYQTRNLAGIDPAQYSSTPENSTNPAAFASHFPHSQTDFSPLAATFPPLRIFLPRVGRVCRRSAALARGVCDSSAHAARRGGARGRPNRNSPREAADGSPATVDGSRLAHLLAERRRLGTADDARLDAAAGRQAGSIQWPTPQPLPVGPLLNYGYEGEVLLLTDLTVAPGFAPAVEANATSAAAAKSVAVIAARADWLVCKEICIPEGADLTLTLPVAGAPAAASPIRDGAGRSPNAQRAAASARRLESERGRTRTRRWN